MDREAQELFEKLALFFTFIAERKRDSAVLRRMQQHLHEYGAAGDIKKLRRLQKEIESRVRETFSDTDKSELKRRWGSAIELADEETVRTIEQNGCIANDKEYAVVLSYVDRNFNDSALRARIDLCNSLLANYHRQI